MELLTAALKNYVMLGLEGKLDRPDHLVQTLLSTKGYCTSIIIGYFPTR